MTREEREELTYALSLIDVAQKWELDAINDAIAELEKEPKTGRWDKSCRCSECGYGIVETEKISGKYKYCPNCGAQML